MKSNELRRLIEQKGWWVKRQNGSSHAIYVHDEIDGIIVFPIHGSKEIPTGVEKKIRKQAGLK